MKPKALDLLDKAKYRAFEQIRYALMKHRKDGNYGVPYKWWSDGEEHECFAYYSQFNFFRLMNWYGDEDQPCFYNSELRKWDTVLNLPIKQLADCADSFLYDIRNNKE